MVYMRGTPADYDGWRQRGCAGWDYASVLLISARPRIRSVGGRVSRRRRTVEGLRSALHERDHRRRHRGGSPGGHPAQQRLQRRDAGGRRLLPGHDRQGRRWSAATAYLRPARSRKNLVVMPEAHATRLLIENGRATGIEFRTRQGLQTAGCRGEIVVAGGVYGSPQLLMLSGIGPGAHLREMGIAVKRDLPSAPTCTTISTRSSPGKRRRPSRSTILRARRSRRSRRASSSHSGGRGRSPGPARSRAYSCVPTLASIGPTCSSTFPSIPSSGGSATASSPIDVRAS